jgi:hypothetical protein
VQANVTCGILYHNETDNKNVGKAFSGALKQLQEGHFKSADVRGIRVIPMELNMVTADIFKLFQ